MRLALAAACISTFLACCPAVAEPIDNVMAVTDHVRTFYCTSPDEKSRLVVFAAKVDGEPEKIIMYPEGYPARRLGSVFTADLPNGTLSLDGKRYVMLTDAGTESGVCKPFDQEIINFIMTLAPVDRKALTGSVAAAPVAELQWRIEELEAKVKAGSDDLSNQKSAFEELASDRNNTNPFKDDMDRLKRENDKLKRRICEMDPKATFTVCQP